MGTQSHFDHIQVTPEKRTLATKMALMKIMQTAIVGLCLVTLLGAFPQISSETTTLGPPEEGCYYEDKIIQEIEKVEELVEKCETEKKCVCEDKPVSHCLNYTTVEERCTERREEVCNNISIAACQSVTRTITVEFPTKHCIQKPVENCKYHWEKQEQRDGTIIKVWAKILSSCNTSYVDMCEDVLDTREKEVSVEVPIEQQIPFCETVTKKSCEPREVVKESCSTKWIKVCREEEYQECKKWHVLKDVPKNVTIHIQKCDDITLAGNSVETEVFDVRET